MKKLFVIAIFLLTLAWVLPSKKTTIKPAPSPTPSSKPSKPYAFITTEPKNISLIPNFSEKKTSSAIMTENNCAAGINGSFYDTNNQPLGLFIDNGKVLRKSRKSALMNGFIRITNEKAFIGQEEPDSSSQFALQTGPLLILSGQQLPLAIKNDEPARRMVAAINTEGALIFLTLYDTENTFSGPRLMDVPEIITKINKEELLNITDAINLDGGSASAFYNEATNLSELTPIGSFFCIKELQ